MSPGFRISAYTERPATELWQGFGQYTTPDISDTMHGLFCLSSALRNLVNALPLLGPAFTVKLPAFDNLMLHKALDLVQAGDVVVVQAGANRTDVAICGDLLAQKLAHKGVAGLVIDGLIRDLKGLKTLNLPIFARGTTAKGPFKQGPGEINTPVSCGGQVIFPGDLIVGDEMGLLVVPQADIPAVLDTLHQQQASQQHYLQQVKAGQFDNNWVQDKLSQMGLSEPS